MTAQEEKSIQDDAFVSSGRLAENLYLAALLGNLEHRSTRPVVDLTRLKSFFVDLGRRNRSTHKRIPKGSARNTRTQGRVDRLRRTPPGAPVHDGRPRDL